MDLTLLVFFFYVKIKILLVGPHNISYGTRQENLSKSYIFFGSQQITD